MQFIASVIPSPLVGAVIHLSWQSIVLFSNGDKIKCWSLRFICVINGTSRIKRGLICLLKEKSCSKELLFILRLPIYYPSVTPLFRSLPQLMHVMSLHVTNAFMGYDVFLSDRSWWAWTERFRLRQKKLISPRYVTAVAAILGSWTRGNCWPFYDKFIRTTDWLPSER